MFIIAQIAWTLLLVPLLVGFASEDVFEATLGAWCMDAAIGLVDIGVSFCTPYASESGQVHQSL